MIRENATLRGDRWVAFREVLTFGDFDFTGAAFAMQLRLYGDATGSPLVSLTTQTTDVQGVRTLYGGTATVEEHIAAGRLTPLQASALLSSINQHSGRLFELTDPLVLSQVAVRIDELTMEGLPFPGSGAAGERGDDVVLLWDLHVTPAGGTKDKYAGGPFIVRPGATEN